MDPHARVHEITARFEGGRLSTAQAAALGDPGGATQYGISQRLLNSLGVVRTSLGAPLTVDAVTPQIAERIGRALFWEPTQIGALWPASPALALVTYDCAFQSGPERAVRILQRALAAREDGVLGPRTLAAARECTEPLLAALDAISERRAWLARWAAQDAARTTILRGLNNRCDDLVIEAVKLEAECRGWQWRSPLRAA